MKALSVKQPYASLIASGEKTLEIRRWRTSYRGPLLICSTRRPVLEDHPTGVAMCNVDLVDVIDFARKDARRACAPWRPDHFAWVLENPCPCRHIPVKGQQRIFSVSGRFER